MAYRTIREAAGIYVQYSGQTSDMEVARLIAEFQADARYDSIWYVLHDFSAREGLRYSRMSVEELAATDAAAALSKIKHRVAVVTDRADVRAMVDVYVATGFHPKDKLRIFPDLESARDWVCA